MLRRVPVALASVIALPLLLPAQGTASATTRNGFAVERLARIDRFLQESVDQERVAGVVGLVLRDGRVVYERALGWSDREANRRMTADAIFRIASQSKAITTTAAMILVEEGKLALSDPVSRHISAFRHTSVSLPNDSIAPARRQITVFDLLTHSAGISYGTEPRLAGRYQAAQLGPAAGYGWYTADKDEPVCSTMERLASLPFAAQPGTAWVYGYNTDILGCVIERASGIPLDEFIRTRITTPLGMKDTHFFLPPAQRDRLTTLYASGEDGKAVRAPDGARGQGHYAEGPRRSFSGGAGLVSTARDYARFLQMLLNGGTLDGVRILGPKIVQVMTTNQLGTLYGSNGMSFGLGFAIVERAGADGLSSVGTYSWGGAYGSNYKVDPREGLVIVLMIQMLPNSSDVAGRFSTLVYQALVDARDPLAPRPRMP
ncbi:MAG: beta-lactamase family protein [Cytophagaceae bacterium]|nr:beta-lactamase family protein [Gemmatimonadaceae bacterium]